MERWPRAFLKNDKEFKELFGVKKEIFRQMLAVLTVAREKRRKRGGQRPKLSVGDQLLLTLQYWREYRTMSLAKITRESGTRIIFALPETERLSEEMQDVQKIQCQYVLSTCDKLFTPFGRKPLGRNGR